MKICISFIILTYFFISYGQLPSYAPNSDLLAWYSYSGNVLDNSGNGHNNADYSISLTTDRFNTVMRALQFNGSGVEYLNYGDVDDFEGHLQFSTSFWILPENYGQSVSAQVRPILSKWTAPQDLQGSSYNIFLDDQNLNFLLTDGQSTDAVKADLSHIFLNYWSHVVITFNYGITKIYVNNTLVADTNISISQIKSSNADFRVGDWYHSVDPGFVSFDGKIDDLGIWKRDLDECEIEALYTGIDCPTSSVATLPHSSDRKVVKIVDLMGREVDEAENTLLIYVYSDGSLEKVVRIE